MYGLNIKDLIDWLSRALQNAFDSRDVPTQVAAKDFKGIPDLVLSIQKYQIANYYRQVYGA